MEGKSEIEKRVFALWTAGMLTLLIFGIWLLNFISVFGNRDNSKVAIKNEANPISALLSEIKKTASAPIRVYQNK